MREKLSNLGYAFYIVIKFGNSSNLILLEILLNYESII